MSAAPCQHGVPWTDPCAKCHPAAYAKAQGFTLASHPGALVPGVRATITQAPVSTAGKPQVVMADTGGVTVSQAGDTAGHGAPVILHLQPSDLQAGLEVYPVLGNHLALTPSEPRWPTGMTAWDHGVPLDKPCPAYAEKDPVNHPTHYKVAGLPECIEVIEKLGLGYHAGNALKYLWRAGKKDGAPQAQDFRKAAFYLNRLADLMEGKAGKPGVQ